MIIKNILDKPFGPAGTFAGIFIFIVGLITTVLFSFTGLFLALIGAFFGFTYTSTLVDFERKRVKFSSNLFGLIPTGKWLEINSEMKLGLKKSNRVYRAYSRSNRTIDVNKKDIRLKLCGPNKKQLMELKKFDSVEAAKAGIKEYSEHLGLKCI